MGYLVELADGFQKEAEGHSVFNMKCLAKILAR